MRTLLAIAITQDQLITISVIAATVVVLGFVVLAVFLLKWAADQDKEFREKYGDNKEDNDKIK